MNERAITVRQEEAEIELSQRYEEARRSAQAILDASNAKAEEISRRAQEISQESEAMHQRVEHFVVSQEREARERAEELVLGAQQQAERVTAEIEEFSDSVLARTLSRLEQMRSEVEFVQEFVNKRRLEQKTNSVVSQLEIQLRRS